MAEKIQLSQRQRAILRFIADHIRAEHIPPTRREIAKDVGLASHSSVAGHISALIQAGYVERVPGKARGLRVLRSIE